MYLIDVNPADLLDLLHELEWAGMTDGGLTYCPSCLGDEPTHAPTCRLAQTLAHLSPTVPGPPPARTPKEL